MSHVNPPNPCYPTERFVPKDGYYLRVAPLTFGRARIESTNDVLIEAIW